MFPIGAQPRGPRPLRQGGLETRPYKSLNPFATLRPCLPHCRWSKVGLQRHRLFRHYGRTSGQQACPDPGTPIY